MAYDAVYLVRADVEAELDAKTLSLALADNEKSPAEVWDLCAEAADAEVSAVVALIADLGHNSVPSSAILRLYARLVMCRLLYRRHGLEGERNPYEEREAKLRERLDAIANGDTKTVTGFAHLAIDDAEHNIFMEDTDATDSSSSGGGGGGSGGGGTAGVTKLNNLTGAVTIAPGDNIGIEVSGNTLRINGNPGGVTSVSGLTGAVTIVPGANITIAKDGNTLTINGESGTPSNPFTEATAITSPGQGWSVDSNVWIEGDFTVAQDTFLIDTVIGGTLTLGNVTRETWPSTTVNGEDGAVRLLPGANVSITKDGKDLTIAATVSSQPFTPTSRVVSALTATVLATDYLIWFDSEAAGDVQELTLPDMDADAMTIVVRHLGSDYPTTIRRGNSTYQLAGEGAAVAIDWLKATGEWYWRQAY